MGGGKGKKNRPEVRTSEHEKEPDVDRNIERGIERDGEREGNGGMGVGLGGSWFDYRIMRSLTPH